MARTLVNWIIGLTVSAVMMGAVLVGAARAQEATGDWHGTLSSPQAGEVRIGVTISRDAGGVLSGRIVSPDQSPLPIPLTDLRAEAGRLSFTVPNVHAHFAATWDASRQAWAGAWSQGQEVLVVLTKGPVPQLRRPQAPAKPYPYREDEVTVASAPGVNLACTVTTPAGAGPFPAVTLITGSGPQDRDEALLGHKPFLVLSDHLTRKGVAVLRCDDRGYGRSTGAFAEATSTDFAVDAEAQAAFLRARPGIDARHVGLLGHSEGGMIAPMVAAQDPAIAFIVLMAGPGAPIRDLMIAQRAAMAKVNGVKPESMARNEILVAKLNNSVTAAKDTAGAEAAARAVFKAEAPGAPAAAVEAQVRALSSPWYRSFIVYDPRTSLSKVKVPVLALNGDKDVQVVATQNLPAIREALKGNRDVTILQLPGLNHLFQTADTGAPAEYGKIEETISPVALNAVSDWIVKHTGKAAR
jgi:pimeloyl-ACP methyl ester carboxylesterase